MKHWRLLSAILLVAALVGLTARFFALLAPLVVGPESLRGRRVAAALNPLDADNLRRLGVAFLERGEVQEGIYWLERSLAQNTLSPETWKALGKVHLSNPALRQTHFEQGIAELRTAARLGAGRPRLSLSVGIMLLRLWPLLDEGARVECRGRLQRGIHLMTHGEVDAFTRDWYRYSRSWELLAAVLEKCPDTCRRVAQRLLEMEAPLEWRWRLLAAAERRKYAEIRNRFNELQKRGITVVELDELTAQLGQLQGYGQLIDREDKDWIRTQLFRETLISQALQRSMRHFRINSGKASRQQVMVWLNRVVAQTRIVELADLPRRLEEMGFWRSNDLLVRELRFTLDMRNGNHAEALSGAQDLWDTVKGAAVLRVGLLAVRAAMAVRLMTSAQDFVDAVLQRDPNNLEALWRRVQIDRILREDVDQADLKRLQIAALIDLAHEATATKALPLVEGVKAGVKVPEAPGGIKRLLQVYLDGAILLEKYLNAEAQTVWLDVPVPEDSEPMPWVRARILEIKTGEG